MICDRLNDSLKQKPMCMAMAIYCAAPSARFPQVFVHLERQQTVPISSGVPADPLMLIPLCSRALLKSVYMYKAVLQCHSKNTTTLIHKSLSLSSRIDATSMQCSTYLSPRQLLRLTDDSLSTWYRSDLSCYKYNSSVTQCHCPVPNQFPLCNPYPKPAHCAA